MKKPDRFKFGAALGLAVALVFYAGTGAWAQLDTDLPGGHLKIQTALETDWGVSTAGKHNRNNNNNHLPGSGQGFSTDGNDLQYANGRIEPLITFRASDDIAQRCGSTTPTCIPFSLLGGRRAVNQWSEHVHKLDKAPTRRRASRGIPAMHGQPASANTSTRPSPTRHTSICARDLRVAPGQSSRWSRQELGLQILDQVDSLDFTNFRAFRSLRWSSPTCASLSGQPKRSYQLPDFSEAGINNSIITGFVSPDFQPTYLPSEMVQWINDDPVFEPIGDYGNIRRARNKMVDTGRWRRQRFMALT